MQLATRHNGATRGFDALFVLPGDSPALHPSTFGALRACAEHGPSPIVYPRYAEEKGHPLLIQRACFEAVLGFTGEGGLRAALRPFEKQGVAVDDEGVLLDADEPRDFALLESYVRRTKGISDELAEGLLDEAETPQNVREHCRAVSAVAARMASRLNALGFCLDSQLCRSAALLHDMCRVHRHHEQHAAHMLRTKGYDVLARLVGAHGSFSNIEATAGTTAEPATGTAAGIAAGIEAARATESLIVCVADKLVQGTRRVTPDERYAPAMEKFPASGEIGQRIRQDLLHCTRFLAYYEMLTGDRL
jgi:putative nucleotidyltransferase with HDIG domain